MCFIDTIWSHKTTERTRWLCFNPLFSEMGLWSVYCWRDKQWTCWCFCGSSLQQAPSRSLTQTECLDCGLASDDAHWLFWMKLCVCMCVCECVFRGRGETNVVWDERKEGWREWEKTTYWFCQLFFSKIAKRDWSECDMVPSCIYVLVCVCVCVFEREPQKFRFLPPPRFTAAFHLHVLQVCHQEIS